MLTSLPEERQHNTFPAKSLRRGLVTPHVIRWLKLERKYADDKYPVSTIEQFGGVLRDEDVDFVM